MHSEGNFWSRLNDGEASMQRAVLDVLDIAARHGLSHGKATPESFALGKKVGEWILRIWLTDRPWHVSFEYTSVPATIRDEVRPLIEALAGADRPGQASTDVAIEKITDWSLFADIVKKMAAAA